MNNFIDLSIIEDDHLYVKNKLYFEYDHLIMGDINNTLLELNIISPNDLSIMNINENKFVKAIKYVYDKIMQFLTWLLNGGKKPSLNHTQMLSHPSIRDAGAIPFTIIGTPIIIRPESYMNESACIVNYEDYQSFNEAIKDQGMFTRVGTADDEYMNIGTVLVALKSFAKRFNVNVAYYVGSDPFKVSRAFMMRTTGFVKAYRKMIENKEIIIVHTNDDCDSIVCINALLMSCHTVDQFEITIAHEYGHVLTEKTLSTTDELCSHLLIILLRSFKKYDLETYYLRAYYETPTEKIANDAVGMVSESDIAKVAGIDGPVNSAWRDSIFGKIVKLNIPVDILHLALSTIDELSTSDIKRAIEYSILVYSEIIPDKNASDKIVSYLRSLDPEHVRREAKNNGGYAPEKFWDIRTNLQNPNE